VSTEKNVLIVNCGGNSALPSEHNFITKLLAMQRAGLLPASGAFETDIRHDDWCGFLAGGRCNCDPEIKTQRKAREA
jgi:hypothetical protein